MDVLIVGAGPAGAALAWMLGRSGLRVGLLDQQGADPANADRPPFRGEALMPSGLKALEAMGLTQLLNSIPSRTLTGWRMQVDGKSLFFAREPWGGPLPCTLVPQDALLAALVERCRQLEGVSVEMGLAVNGLLVRPDGVVEGVRLEDGQIRRAHLVVATDGRGSRLRHLAGLELEPAPGPGMIVDWFSLPTADPDEAPADQPGAGTTFLSVIGGGELFSFFGSAQDGRHHLALVREPQDAPPARGDQLAQQLAALAPEEQAKLLRHQGKALEHPVSLQVQVGQARPWHRPGFLLLGDAAHPMSPVRAQGLNMALRDALVAGRLLAKALPAGDRNTQPEGQLNRTLAAIEARRRPEISAMQRLQAQETRRGLLLRRQPLMRALLAAAAPWIGPRLQHHWMNDQLPLRLGLDDLSDDGGTPAAAMVRSIPPHSALALALLLSAGLSGALAKTPPEVPDPPTTEALRTIQLAAQVCARDNNEANCSRTRQLADPLLDHAGVSASCKDSVYDLVQRAKVGDAGSYSRRERIEKAAGDVLQFCRPKTRVVGDGNSTGKPGATPGSPFSLRGEPQQTP